MSRVLWVLFAYVVLCIPVHAQDIKQIYLRDVLVVSTTQFSGAERENNIGLVQVSLWGVNAIDADVGGVLAMEDTIKGAPVNCTVKNWLSNNNIVAQCIAQGDADIALKMLSQGYVMADRQAVKGTVFESVYMDAERNARMNDLGVWRNINTPEKSGVRIDANNTEAFHLTADAAYFAITAMILGPFIGMLIVGGIIYAGFRRLINLQKYQIAMSNKKDRTMREREKFIVAASLEGEMNTNRAKLDAFLIIYEELLRNLRDPLKDHKYKKAGDIIHCKPALSRNVYDSNIDKLDLLGVSLVTDLTGLYTEIEPNPDYKTIEPDAPIADVIDFVAGIVRDAEKMLSPMDRIASALNVIVRDKRAKTSDPMA